MNKKANKKSISTDRKQLLEKWDKKIKTGDAINEIKENLLKNSYTNCDPRHSLTLIAEKIFPKCLKEGNGFEGLTEEERNTVSQFQIDFGIENDLSMVEAVETRYRGLIMNLRRQLIKEFDCKTYYEKSLVDMITGAYARNLSYTKKFLTLKDPELLSSERNGFLAVLSKEIDRANRHFITGLETLKQFKQPELKVNVKTKNAFIAQNQQLNNIPNENIKD